MVTLYFGDFSARNEVVQSVAEEEVPPADPPAETGPAPEEEVLQPSRKRRRRGILPIVGVVVIVILVVTVAYVVWWSPKTPYTKQDILGAGSTLVQPLMDSWESNYTTDDINYQGVGSGQGITDICSKYVDYAASDAPISPVQYTALACLAYPATILTMPESASAVAIIFNIPGVTSLRLNGPLLAAIFLGDITFWNNSGIAALNPGVSFPSSAIGVVHRSDGSGTSFAFTEWLSRENATWASQVGYATNVNWPTGTGEHGSAGVASYVGSTPDTIGYVDLEYALNQGLATASILNPQGQYVLPSLASATVAVQVKGVDLPNGSSSWYNVSLLNANASGAYPITTFTYTMFFQDQSEYVGQTQVHARALVNFLWWIITTGQDTSASLNYVPLPASIVAADEATLNSVTFDSNPVGHS